MAFRFNFLQEETEEPEPEQDTNEDGDEQILHGVRILMEPEEMTCRQPNKLVSTLQFGDQILYRLDDEDNSSDYDLIPGTYEGIHRFLD
jgi:hypothetical protein